MDKNYFNGSCSSCMFAHRDDRGRYVSPCLGYSNCSYEEYKDPEPEMTEEEKDKYIELLETYVRNATYQIAQDNEVSDLVLKKLKEEVTKVD